jgi:hypothetical protein
MTWTRRAENGYMNEKGEVEYICNTTKEGLEDMFGFHFNCQADFAVKQEGFLLLSSGRIKPNESSTSAHVTTGIA